MAACPGSLTLFSALFYMFEICHGMREREEKNKKEGIERKVKRREKRKEILKREKAVSHFRK